jgi:hypothetical protein
MLRWGRADLDGFRPYHMVKSVLMHELAHMVHSEHNADFHRLNRQLEREAVALDWTQSRGQRVGGADVNPNDPPTEDDDDARRGSLGEGTYTLGGDRAQVAQRPPRELMLEAALVRLTAEEQAITDGCGGSGPTPPERPPTHPM